MIAAAFVTVATELVGALLFYRLFRREFGAGFDLPHALRLIACAVIMGIVIYALRDLSMLLLIPLGGGIYIAAVLLTRSLTSEEQALLAGLLRRATNRLGLTRA
jgi:hypothetical protein